MSRALSTAAKSAVFAQETGEAFLILLTIDHADLGSPVRVVNNQTDITSRGDLYVGFPFEVTLPDEDPDGMAMVQLKIDNVDRQIVDSIRSVSSPPTVTLEVVMGSTPDTVEGGPFEMQLRNASYDAFVVTGSLSFEPVLSEPFPGGSFIPSEFPGLF